MKLLFMILFNVICTFGVLYLVQADTVMSSISKLRRLANIEREILVLLDQYIVDTNVFYLKESTNKLHDKYSFKRNKLDKLKRIFEDATLTNQIDNGSSKQATVDIVHPLNAFHLIYRFIYIWNEMESLLDSVRGKDLDNYIKTFINDTSIIPSQGDFTGVCKSIFRLQNTFKLNATQIADGEVFLSGRKNPASIFGPPLSVEQCFKIGKEAYTKGQNDMCVIWMIEAERRMLDNYPLLDGDEASLEMILEYKSYCQYLGQNYYRALKTVNQLLEINPFNTRGITNQKSFAFYAMESNLTGEHEEPEYPTRGDIHPTFLDYERICRRETLLSPEEIKILKCFYTDNHPMLILQPVATEELSQEPQIISFKSVVTNEEADKIISLAEPKLNRSGVLDENNLSRTKVRDQRVSQTIFLKDQDYPDILLKITKRIERIIGLSGEQSEPYQVLNYGVGGQYEPHFDVHEDEEDPYKMYPENRIATFFIYLSDVELGGSTAFNLARVGAIPVKGDAVFWYNKLKNGKKDNNSLHAGCPILYGDKWAANKWINGDAQTFIRKCGLEDE